MAQVLSPQVPSNGLDQIPSGHAPARPEASLTLDGYAGPVENVHLLTPSYPDTPIEELQKRFAEDGVLWVKGLLDRDLVNTFRGEYLSFVNEGTHLLKDGSNPVDGIFSGDAWQNFVLPGAVRRALGLKDEGPFVERAIASHRSEEYDVFKNKIGTTLESFAGRLADMKDPYCLPRSLLRIAVPGGETTPVHYDQIFLRKGPPTSVTAWIPIGDIGLYGGGLIYLERSHDIGKKYELDFDKLNKDLSDDERTSAYNQNMMAGGWLERSASRFGKNCERTWLTGAYEAGDVVFHNPYMVHAGAKNQDPDSRIRVSTDIRFVDRSKPYDERWTVLAYSENDPNVPGEKK